MIVYAFKYCPCIYESADATISLHKTKEGAELALQLHKYNCLKEYEDYLNELDTDARKWVSEFRATESWSIEEIEILD